MPPAVSSKHLVIEAHEAMRRSRHPRDDVQHRRFAGSGRAHERGQTGVELDVDVETELADLMVGLRPRELTNAAL